MERIGGWSCLSPTYPPTTLPGDSVQSPLFQVTCRRFERNYSLAKFNRGVTVDLEVEWYMDSSGSEPQL